MEFQELLNQVKNLELNLSSQEKIDEFKQGVEKLKSFNDESHAKTISKLEEKAEYAQNCLENKNKKEVILVELQQLLNQENVLDALNEAKILKDRFNSISYAGKNEDERLSRQFRELNDQLVDKKYELNLQRQSQFNQNKLLKEALIEESKKIVQNKDFKKANEQLNQIFDEWKKIGFSGKENEELLWEKFLNVRQDFFSERKKFFEAQEAQRVQSEKNKLEIIEKAKALVLEEDYSKEKAEIMKSFDVEWKKCGYSLNNDTLWESFSEIKNQFWEKRKEITAEKQAEFKVMIQEVITRKSSQVENLEKQVFDLKSRIGSIRNDEQITRMKGWISEKELILEKLYSELSDLKSKLN